MAGLKSRPIKSASGLHPTLRIQREGWGTRASSDYPGIRRLGVGAICAAPPALGRSPEPKPSPTGLGYFQLRPSGPLVLHPHMGYGSPIVAPTRPTRALTAKGWYRDSPPMQGPEGRPPNLAQPGRAGRPGPTHHPSAVGAAPYRPRPPYAKRWHRDSTPMQGPEGRPPNLAQPGRAGRPSHPPPERRRRGTIPTPSALREASRAARSAVNPLATLTNSASCTNQNASTPKIPQNTWHSSFTQTHRI